MVKKRAVKLKNINVYHSYLLKIHSDGLRSGNKHGHNYFQNNINKTKA